MANITAPSASWENRTRAPAAAPLAIVETATPGVYEFVDTGVATEAVIEETATAGMYEITDTPGAGARATPILYGGVGIVLE